MMGVNCLRLSVFDGHLAVPLIGRLVGWFALLFFLIMIHIGEEIEREVRRQGRSVSWLAAALYCDRTNVYKIFRKPSLDSELLYRISVALSYNFFHFYTDQFPHALFGVDISSTNCG